MIAYSSRIMVLFVGTLRRTVSTPRLPGWQNIWVFSSQVIQQNQVEWHGGVLARIAVAVVRAGLLIDRLGYAFGVHFFSV
jgi:hypothetical protein